MGYGGKIVEQNRCRALRALGWTYNEIAAEVAVSKSSVSLWCRDVEPDPEAWAVRAQANRNYGVRHKRPHPQQIAKQEEIERLQAEGAVRFALLTEQEFRAAGAMLYAGEGAKGPGAVKLANCDPRIILFFLNWLRRFFPLDERRLRGRMYLHRGLDLEEVMAFWVGLTGIPERQWGQPYRAEPTQGRGTTKHVLGCPSVGYSSTSFHREIMGWIDALLALPRIVPG